MNTNSWGSSLVRLYSHCTDRIVIEPNLIVGTRASMEWDKEQNLLLALFESPGMRFFCWMNNAKGYRTVSLWSCVVLFINFLRSGPNYMRKEWRLSSILAQRQYGEALRFCEEWVFTSKCKYQRCIPFRVRLITATRLSFVGIRL
jgi:hypothetical protein